jgi:hypothetical protein
MNERTEPSDTTREAERDEAEQQSIADRAATPEEEAAAEAFPESDEERTRVAEHFKEMNELGANAKGEGRIV